jgi:hypothetical protein
LSNGPGSWEGEHEEREHDAGAVLAEAPKSLERLTKNMELQTEKPGGMAVSQVVLEE